MKIFRIKGYWVDDKRSIDGYLIAEYNDIPKNYSDDEIFFYGLSEQDIKEAIKTGDPVENEWVITGYEIEPERTT